MDVFRAIIIAAQHVQMARDEAAKFEGGAGMFTTELSPSGLAPATAYISSGYISDALAAALSQADISEEQPFAAMARLGLKLVQETV